MLADLRLRVGRWIGMVEPERVIWCKNPRCGHIEADHPDLGDDHLAPCRRCSCRTMRVLTAL